MDRLDAMALFVAIADARGFAAAAKRMRVSPSVATRVIATLEERLGTRLLQRTTRSVTLTDAGTRYLDRARRILAEVTEAEDAARTERVTPTGRLIVSAPTVFGRLHVASALSEYLRRYPAVRADLVLTDSFANLVEEGIDVAIRIGSLDDSSLVARNVGETRRVLVASPAYLAKSRALRNPSDLSRHRLIQFTGLAPTREWAFVRDGRESRVTVPVDFVTNSADAAIVHAEHDGGVAMVLSYQVRESVRTKRLKVVLAAFEPPPRPVNVVFPTARLLSAKVRAFVDFVATTQQWRFVDL